MGSSTLVLKLPRYYGTPMLGYLAEPIIKIWQFPQIVANLGPLLHEMSFEIKLFTSEKSLAM
jgi:hypothetical protein